MAAPILLRAGLAWLAVAALPATTLAPKQAHAQNQARPGGGNQRIAFDIPAQPLDAALTSYFRASGVQLLYDSALTAGRRSNAVRGSLTPREALRQLLLGTGLIARYSRANAAIITSPDSSDTTPLVPLGRVVVRERVTASPRASAIQRMAFYAQLSDELEAHLRRDRRTDRLTFSVHASIQIAPGGKLEHVRIERGQDPRAEQAIAEVLSGKIVSPPPEGIAQPLLVVLKGKAGAHD
ncbi:STN domain-containing protein [Sphingomonas sp. KR3-1]|uniref:STN domain-containing protein n=1 Tax=Sphingomonas sp. KR3-1 TaxID=3156611 RepID=UPI0032B61486